MIPVAAYPMNVCKFSNGELKELDQLIKWEMRSSNILESKEVIKGCI